MLHTEDDYLVALDIAQQPIVTDPKPILRVGWFRQWFTKIQRIILRDKPFELCFEPLRYLRC